MSDQPAGQGEPLAGMDALIQHRAYALEPDTMTRAERIAEYLTTSQPNLSLTKRDELIAAVLAIADDRTLLSLGDVCRLTGRAPSTVKSWLRPPAPPRVQNTRPNPGFPQPAYQVAAGGLWDEEVIVAWSAEHPEQVRVQD